MNFGEKIYTLRVNKNLSQGDLADLLNVSRQSISKWENNSAVPDLDKIIKLCEIFEISMDELVRDKKISEAGAEEQNKSTSDTFTDIPEPKSKTAGILLFGMAFFTILIFAIIGNVGAGLVFSIPFIVCAVICLISKRHAGLWCAWAVLAMVMLFCMFTMGQRHVIFSFFHYNLSDPSMSMALIIGWAQNIALIILTGITIWRFRDKPFSWTKRNKVLLIAGIIALICVKFLQIMLPIVRFYEFLLYVLNSSAAYVIISHILDFLKIGITVALVTNMARIHFKKTIKIFVAMVILSSAVSVFINLRNYEKIDQNPYITSEPTIGKPSTRKQSIYEHGLDIVELLEEIVHNEEYITMFSGSGEIAEIINGIAEGDYSEPEVVYQITLNEQALLEAEEMMPNDISEALKQSLQNRLLASLPTNMNARNGAKNLAATAICTAGKTFVNTDIEESLIYLYVYEDALPVVITFIIGEHDTVSASGHFLFSDVLDQASLEEMLEYAGALSVQVEVVYP